MTTFTVSPAPATGSVRLELTPELPTEKVTRIQRSDANGTYDVRTLEGFLPAGPETFVVDDYEAAQGTLTYTVTTANGGVITTATATAELELDSPWLGVPTSPQFGLKVQTVTGYEAGVDTLSSVVQPEERLDPVAILRGGSTRSGTLELVAGDHPAGLALLRLAQRPAVLQYRQAEHTGADMFLVAKRATLRPLKAQGAGTVWGVSLEYIEVGRPAGPLDGALGWTWGALKSQYQTWADVFAAFASWGDVRTDTPKGS